MVGIVAFGGYVPRARLSRRAIVSGHAWFAPELKALGKGERAIANWDEDCVTMAVEAARDAFHGFERSRISRLVLASTTFPFADRQNAGIVKEALNLSDDMAVLDVAGSQRAGTSALLDALHASKGGGGDILCLASEKRRARAGSELELMAGDAAAALIVGDGEVAAEFLAGHSVTIDFIDHFRSEGQNFDYGWEPRWIREEGYGKIVPLAVSKALTKANLSADRVDRLILAAPAKGVNRTAAAACGIAEDRIVDSLADVLGDAGAAQPLVLLAHALETAKAGEILLLAGFGQGCDVAVFRATGRRLTGGLGVSGWLARRKAEENYVKFLTARGALEVERGMRAEFDQKTSFSALYRNRKTVFALVGGKCAKTGAVQFPKSLISVAQNDRATGTQEDYPLADLKARIVTHTSDWLTYTPEPPAYYGAVEFEEGGRLTVEFADVEPEDVEVGSPVRMMFRIKAVDPARGFVKYFWKAVPDYMATAVTSQ